MGGSRLAMPTGNLQFNSAQVQELVHERKESSSRYSPVLQVVWTYGLVCAVPVSSSGSLLLGLAVRTDRLGKTSQSSADCDVFYFSESAVSGFHRRLCSLG